jgi:hypothetical protein
MIQKKVNFSIKNQLFHLDYDGVSLIQSLDGRTNDQVWDFCDSIVYAINCHITPKILAGEICGLHFLDDPHLLIFIPWEDEITVIFETECSNFFRPWHELTIPLDEWFIEVKNTTEDLIHDIPAFPEIYQHGIPLKMMIECYENTKKLLKNHGYLNEFPSNRE